MPQPVHDPLPQLPIAVLLHLQDSLGIVVTLTRVIFNLFAVQRINDPGDIPQRSLELLLRLLGNFPPQKQAVFTFGNIQKRTPDKDGDHPRILIRTHQIQHRLIRFRRGG